MTTLQFKKGDRVRILKGRGWGGSCSWHPDMDKYVGVAATITQIDGDGDVLTDATAYWYFSPKWLEPVKAETRRILFNRKPQVVIDEADEVPHYWPVGIADDLRANAYQKILFGDWQYGISPLQILKEKTMNVQNTMKRLALKATNPNEVAKRDAGLKDDCGNLTEAGKEALLGMLETKFDEQFTKLANDINAENESKA